MGPQGRTESSKRAGEIGLSTDEHGFEEIVLDGRYATKDDPMPVSLDVNPALEYKGYQALVSRTIEVFGDELKASRWLSMPTSYLNGRTPLEVAGNLHYDLEEVQSVFEPIFIRIEHGIYV